MRFDRLATDLSGFIVMTTGLISLTESLLQVRLIGSPLPLVQGTLVSLFAVSFGAVLLTESASEAFHKLRTRK